MTRGVRVAFRALTVACVPAAARFGEEAWTRAEAIVDDALAERSAGVRRQLALFVRALDVVAVLRWGKRLGSLEAGRARRLLASLERSRVLALRRGAWGVRTLCFMGVYGQPDVREAVGYAARLRGWEERGVSPGPWPERDGAAPPETGVLTAGGGAPDA